MKLGRPGTICTCTSTGTASIPSKDTVVTCETIRAPRLQVSEDYVRAGRSRKNRK